MAFGAEKDFLFQPATATSDGEFLFGSLKPRDYGENGGSVPIKVVYMDRHTGQMTVIRSLPHNDTQVGSVASDGKWVVWMEAAQEPNFFSDWALYAYNRTDQSIKQVAKAPRDKAGNIISGPTFMFGLDHSIVVWSEASTVAGDMLHSIVKDINLETGQVQVLTDTGLGPKISWPYVAWMGPKIEPGKALQDAKSGVIVVLDLQTGLKKTLAGPDTPSDFTIYKDSVAYITTDGKQLILMNMAETYYKVIAIAQNQAGNLTEDYLTGVSMNDRLVSWMSPIRAQVWDRVQERIVATSSNPGLQFVTNNTLIWIIPGKAVDRANPALQSNDQIIDVLDTSKLPTSR